MTTFSRRLQVHETIKQEKERHLERIRQFMAQPSVALENHGVRECAALLQGYYQELGCLEAEIVETPAFPAVWAYYDAGAPKTLAVYGYFDTNVVGEGWTKPPYDAVVAEHPPFKRVVYGRGGGSKGGFAAFLNTLEVIKKTEGNLPVNLMFVTEGDEFLGSNQIPFLIEKYRSKLSKADALISPRPCQTASGDVALYLGSKGCLHIEMECSGEKWGRGPIGGAIHSSAQTVVDQPVWRLLSALSTMYDSAKNCILIEGFNEGLREPTPAERMLVKALAERYRGKETSAMSGISGPERVHKFIDDISGEDLFTRYNFAPTMNINGIRSGYTGPGTLLWTLPHVANCTIDIRLPADLDPQDCVQKIRRHLDERGFSDITIQPLEATPGDIPLLVEEDLVQAVLRVFKAWKVEPVIWPRRGAGGPLGLFSKMLGVKLLNSTGMSFASGHSDANEFLVVEGNEKVGGLVELEQSYADLLYSYAAYPQEY